MTPYIITTYLPGGCLDPIGAGQEPDSQRAATTLEKVHEATKAIIDDLPPDHDAQRDWSDHYAAAMVDEDGGTIDLPDGTVIEVKPMHRRELLALTDRPHATGTDAEAVHAFNLFNARST